MRAILATALRYAAVSAIDLAERLDPHVRHLHSTARVPAGGWSMSVNGKPWRPEVN